MKQKNTNIQITEANHRKTDEQALPQQSADHVLSESCKLAPSSANEDHDPTNRYRKENKHQNKDKKTAKLSHSKVGCSSTALTESSEEAFTGHIKLPFSQKYLVSLLKKAQQQTNKISTFSLFAPRDSKETETDGRDSFPSSPNAPNFRAFETALLQ
jgi:hypothetical protein